MKGFVLGLVLLISSSAFATDTVSQLVSSAVAKGLQILSLKSAPAREHQMCSLIKKALNSKKIGVGLLGDYNQMSEDQAGIDQFIKIIPSDIVSEIMKNAGKVDGNSMDVNPNSFDRGDGTFEVGVTVHASNGNAYNGKLIIERTAKGYRLVDGEYFGFSVVHYLGNDIQKKIAEGAAANPNDPISAYNKTIMSDAGFINCP